MVKRRSKRCTALVQFCIDMFLSLVKRLKMHAIHMQHAKIPMEVILVNVLTDFTQVGKPV